MAIEIVALLLPLSLDTFAVSVALALGGLPAEHRLRTALTFTAFEAVMPLVGLALGAPLGGAAGDAAGYVAIGVLGAVGVYALVGGGDERGVGALADRRGLAAVALGLSVSLDEIAIGFTFGLLRLPVAPAIALIAGQAFVASQLGLRLGKRVGERASERAERLAGVALSALATGLLVAKLTR